MLIKTSIYKKITMIMQKHTIFSSNHSRNVKNNQGLYLIDQINRSESNLQGARTWT